MSPAHEVLREREDEQHEAAEEAEGRPADHPRRVPVERRAGDLLDQSRDRSR